jgi:hypothetical protein
MRLPKEQAVHLLNAGVRQNPNQQLKQGLRPSLIHALAVGGMTHCAVGMYMSVCSMNLIV